LHVHSDGEEREVVGAMAREEFLPDRQVVTAASPTGPAIDEHALTAQFVQRHGRAVECSEPQVRRDGADARDASDVGSIARRRNKRKVAIIMLCDIAWSIAVSGQHRTQEKTLNSITISLRAAEQAG